MEFEREDWVRIIGGSHHIGRVGWVMLVVPERDVVHVSLEGDGGYGCLSSWLEKVDKGTPGVVSPSPRCDVHGCDSRGVRGYEKADGTTVYLCFDHAVAGNYCRGCGMYKGRGEREGYIYCSDCASDLRMEHGGDYDWDQY